MPSDDAEQGSECAVAGTPAVEAEDEFIEVRIGGACRATRDRRPNLDLDAGDRRLEILCQAAISIEPNEGSFDDPSA